MASTTNRRRFLALGVGAAIAGCLGSEPPVADDDAARADDAPESAESAAPADSTDAAAGDYSGPFELPVPEDELRRGAPIDAIPAITAPVFADDWTGFDGSALVAAGSRWDLLTGRALDGPHEGAVLTRANDRSPMFWFAWADFNPETEIHGA